MTVHQIMKSRKELGLTQKQLSKMIRKNSTFICKLESGDRHLREDIELRIKKVFALRRKASKRPIKKVAKKARH